MKQRLLQLKAKKEEKLDDYLRTIGRRNIKAYQPHEIQRQFHQSDARIRFFLGANASGKTMAGACETIFHATKKHPFKPWVNDLPGPTHGIVYVVDHIQQKEAEGPQDKLMSWLPESEISKVTYFRNDAIDTVYLKNFGTIAFKSSKAPQKSLMGMRLRFIWIDEECIPSARHWNEMVTRIPAEGRLYIWMTATPNLEEVSWMQDTLYAKANKPESDIRIFQSGLDDNPHISDQAKSDIKGDLQGDDSVEYNARVYGDWQLRKGLVYNFSKSVHVIPPVDERTVETAKGVWQIIDPHEAKPIAVLWGMVDAQDRAVVFDELSMADIIANVADTMKRRSAGFQHLLVRTIMDYAGNKRVRTGEGRSIREEFRRYGIHTTNSVKDVVGGISVIKRLLYHNSDEGIAPRLYVCANCTKTIREFFRYSWGKDGKPKKIDDEYMDCIRYWTSDPTFGKYLRLDNVKREVQSFNGDEKSLQNIARNARLRRQAESVGVGVGRRSGRNKRRISGDAVIGLR